MCNEYETIYMLYNRFVKPTHTKSILSIVGVESESLLINEMGKVP